MFWKLALTASALLLLAGRSGVVRNPMVRLLLPRSWAARLAPPPAAPGRAPQPWLSTRAYIFLLVVAATGVAAWIVTRALILQPTSAAP